ncbi:MAG: DUF3299 domain-containing protein [Pseudomonadota bacterium]
MRSLVFLIVWVTASAIAAEPPLTLYWKDLMPEGGHEALERQQSAYLASVEEKLRSQTPQSLLSAGRAGGYSAIAEGSAFDVMPQLGTYDVVEELDGVRVRVPGFVTPFEYSASGKIKEFLLVPYFGACIHTPPPPPNQMVYVTAKKALPLGDQWRPIWATGVLRAKRYDSELGGSAYTLEIEAWEIFDG